MGQCGSLVAVRDGSNVKLTIFYPQDYRDAFSVEYLAGQDLETGEDVWVSIQFNGHRIARGDTAYEFEMTQPRTYRALVYRELGHPGMLETNGNFSDPVSV